MMKARIAVLLLVVMLMFMAYANERQASVIQKQREEIKMLFQNLIHGGSHG